MNDAWGWWLFFVGLGLGIAGYALVRATIRRTDEDEAADERANEAEWITRTIESWGGEAPADLVAQVLELHVRYLAGDGFLAPEGLPPAPVDAAGAAALASESAPPAPVGASAGRRGHAPDVQRDRAGGEATEVHVSQAG